MKILIHNERADALDFLQEYIINHGYETGIAKNGHEINDMLSGKQYNVVLTNGAYKELNPDSCSWLKSSSVFIIGISDQKKNESLSIKVDMQLESPFESSKLLQALTPAEKTLSI